MDYTVRIWDPTRGEELLRLDLPRVIVKQLQWSPDNRHLAAATTCGAVYVWDGSRGYEYVDSEEYYLGSPVLASNTPTNWFKRAVMRRACALRTDAS